MRLDQIGELVLSHLQGRSVMESSKDTRSLIMKEAVGIYCRHHLTKFRTLGVVEMSEGKGYQRIGETHC